MQTSDLSCAPQVDAWECTRRGMFEQLVYVGPKLTRLYRDIWRCLDRCEHRFGLPLRVHCGRYVYRLPAHVVVRDVV